MNTGAVASFTSAVDFPYLSSEYRGLWSDRFDAPLPFDYTVWPGIRGTRSRAAAYVWHQTREFMALLVSSPLSRATYERFAEPWNWVVIVPNALYRSAEPRALHFSYLAKFGIRTLVSVKRTLPREQTLARAAARGLQVARVDLGADGQIAPRAIRRALKLLMRPELWPVLLHCDGGRHRTGIVTAALRHAQGWTLEDALAEYDRYARPTSRTSDRETIARYFAAPLDAPKPPDDHWTAVYT